MVRLPGRGRTTRTSASLPLYSFLQSETLMDRKASNKLAWSHPKRQARNQSGDFSVSLMKVSDLIGKATSKACRASYRPLLQRQEYLGTDVIPPRRFTMHEIFGAHILRRIVDASSIEHKQLEAWEELPWISK